MSSMMDRLGTAMNAHDIDAFVACFAPAYRSEQPAHPERAFQGRDKVRENWTGVFAGVPDFTCELLSSGTAGEHGEIEFGEWSWSGTHRDGAAFAMRGAGVMGIENNLIAWARLYMEPVERGGADIDQMVEETYRPPPADTHRPPR